TMGVHIDLYFLVQQDHMSWYWGYSVHSIHPNLKFAHLVQSAQLLLSHNALIEQIEYYPSILWHRGFVPSHNYAHEALYPVAYLILDKDPSKNQKIRTGV